MKQVNFYLALLIFLIPLLFFRHTLPYPFIDLDDYTQILENPFIQNFSWSAVWNLFSQFHFGQYKPLTWLTFAIDYSFWNSEPFGFRLTNLIFHALNSSLVFILLRKMKVALTPTLCVSFLFACHPVQIESFVWISARKHVISTFFLLASFINHVEFRKSNKKKCQAITTFSFILALLASPISVVFPFILIAYDYFYLQRSSLKKTIKEHLVSLVFAFIIGAVFIKASFSHWYFRHYSPFHHWHSVTANIPILIWRYMALAFFPIRQSFMYDLLWTGSIWKNAIAALTLAGILIGLYKKRNAQPKLPFWASWFLIFLLPVFLLPRHSILHDRYLYLPLIGLAMAVVVSFNKLTGSWHANHFRKGTVFVLTLLVLTTYASLSWKRSLVWQNNFILISDTLRKAPDHYFSHYGMAQEWMRQEKLEDALKELDKALKAPISPSSYDAVYSTMGQIYFLQRKYDKGIEVMQKALSIAQKDSYYINLGVFYRRTGRFNEAIQSNLKALEIGTKRPEVYNNLGVIYEYQGDFKKAAEAYRTALTLDPNYQEAFQNFITLTKRKHS